MNEKKQIYIHQIQAPSAKNLMPLAAGLLASFLKKDTDIFKNYNIDINIVRENPNTTAQRCHVADVQAFSCYSWNFQQNVAVAKKIKHLNPNCLIVFGGPSISLSQRSEELKVFFNKYNFVDVVVHGMGEWTLLDILKNRLLDKDLSNIDSISYKSKKTKTGYTSNNHSKVNFKKNVNEIPSPFLDGTFDKLLAQHKEIISGTLWETNRGCPFSCTFCVQGDSIFNNVEHFNIERLRDELEWIGRNKIPYIFCTDANFGMFKRDIEIAKMICEIKEKYKFPNYFMVNWGKNLSERVLKVAKVLRSSGLPGRMTLSRQSLNQNTLEAVKRKNISMSTYDDMKVEAQKNNLTSYSELILGLPSDTYDTFTDGLVKCFDKQYSHVVLVYLARLLQGTEMGSPESIKKYGIITRTMKVGFGLYEKIEGGVDEIEDIIVGNKDMPIKDWKKAHTFSAISLTVYNYRLGFYILNYLKDKYSIDYKEFFEYLISSSYNNPSVKLFDACLKTVSEIEEASLNSISSLKSFSYTGNIVYDFHEVPLIVFLNKINDFYFEFRKIVNNFLKLKKISVKDSILDEIFAYQKSLIPNWFYPLNKKVNFKYNIPQYFYALLDDENSIEIEEKSTDMYLTDDIQDLKDPVKFSRARITVGMFRTPSVYKIKTNDIVIEDYKASKTAKDRYDNLEFI